ncbi:hypothetical protein Hanom_Chr12g01146111 [Helianthus anomalus]
MLVTEVKVAVPLVGLQDEVLGRFAVCDDRDGYRIPCGDENLFFIHKVSLLIIRLGQHSGFACVCTTAGKSLSVGAMNRVMVARVQV